MKFFYSIILLVLLEISHIYASPNPLKFSDGSFKIVQFTDLHWIVGPKSAVKNDSTAILMENIIREEKPDLVIITGDIITSTSDLKAWTEMLQPMIRNKVPYAITFGNHDTETVFSKKEILSHLQKLPFNMTENSNANISGVGNVMLPVFSSLGNEKRWAIYLFDSHSYPADSSMGDYDWIKHDQIQWYRDQSDAITKQNKKPLPSLAFFHIPTPEFSYVKDDPYTIGTAGEDVCAPDLNSGLIGSFIEKKDVLGVFVGHDHNNDFIGSYKDKISLAYGRKTGYNAAYNEILERGARVITIYEDERRFETYIRSLSEKMLNYSFEMKVSSEDYPVAEGTFIQDYLVARWSDLRWQEEFKLLKEAGMKYIVFGPAFHTDTNGFKSSIYPSSIENVKEKWSDDLIERCLKNAEKAGFKVFLGINFDERWWREYNDSLWLYNQMELGNAVASELMDRYANRYPNAFHGWYWVWEVANISQLDSVENQEMLANALNINLDYRNEKFPDMPFMLAPYMNYRIGSAKHYGEMWKNVFALTNFRLGDIFAPQDCVGAGGLRLEDVSIWFKELGEAVKTKPELRFWSDAETFDQKYWTSATLNRFVKQMKHVSPHVGKIITFAYSHYYSPLNGEKEFHKAYVEYANTGSFPSKGRPQSVDVARIEYSDFGIHMSWDDTSKDGNVSGYYIYKDGIIVGDIQKRKEKVTTSHFFYKNDKHSGKFQISAYSAIGQESDRTTFVKNP